MEEEKKIIKPQDFWGDPNNSKVWIRRANLKRKAGDKSDELVIKKIGSKFRKVLEVGAGNGRLIGGLSEKYKSVKCNSIDINPELSKYVKEKYPKVITNVGDITKLHYKNKSFDLVYTFQVLQHIHPDDIEKALKELQRISKKEVWLMEGWGNLKKWGLPNGHCRHKDSGGTYYWDFENMLKCYDIEFIEKGKDGNTGIKLYRIKK